MMILTNTTGNYIYNKYNIHICELKLHMIICMYVGSNIIRIYLYYYDTIYPTFSSIKKFYFFELLMTLYFYFRNSKVNKYYL